jgi:colanic acid/amylovoran biosynthesis glycosyltransferase
MKVAYIISIAHGIESWTYREIQALKESGREVVLFPLRFIDGPYMPPSDWDCYHFSWPMVLFNQPGILLRHPVKYLCLFFESLRTRSLVYFLLGMDFSRQMVNKQIDLIHCVFGDHKFFVGYYCKRLLGLPLSVALYGYELKDNPNWRMLRKALPLADTIIVNCEYNRQLLAGIAGSEIGRKARVIHHFAELPPLENKARVRILVVGGFVPRKGHDVLFKAVKLLETIPEKFEVWVAGYPGSVDVQKLASDLGVADRVIVFGSVPDPVLEFLFQNCDIVCLPSKTEGGGVSEGLPVALIEAMAHARPVVATRLGGTSELVENILVEEGDIRGFADALLRYISDPALRQADGARNREIVSSRFSRKNVDEMLNMWQE